MRQMVIPAAAGLFLFLAVPAVPAGQAPESQSWIPPAIELPEDMAVTVDRAIGSSTRIFSFETRADGAVLLEHWNAALAESGYQIKDANPELAARQIDFSGPGIGNAKISIQPGAVDGITSVQFDASLDN